MVWKIVRDSIRSGRIHRPKVAAKQSVPRSSSSEQPPDGVDSSKNCQGAIEHASPPPQYIEPNTLKRLTLHVTHTVFGTGKDESKDTLTLLESLQQKISSQGKLRQHLRIDDTDQKIEASGEDEVKATDKLDKNLFSKNESLAEETSVRSTTNNEHGIAPDDKLLQKLELDEHDALRYSSRYPSNTTELMFEELAKKYLASGGDDIDKRLCKDMERIELPIDNREALNPIVNVTYEQEKKPPEVLKSVEPQKTEELSSKNPQYYEELSWCNEYFNLPRRNVLKVACSLEQISLDNNNRPNLFYDEMKPNCCMEFGPLGQGNDENTSTKKIGFENYDDMVPFHQLQCKEFNQLELGVMSGDPQFFILDENHPEPFHFYLQGNLVDDVSTDPQPTVLSKDYIVPVEEFSDQMDPNESKAHVFHNLCLNDMDTTKFDYTFPHYDSGLQLTLSQPTANPSQSQHDAVEHQAIEKSEEPTSESEKMSEAARESLKHGSSCEKGKEAEEPNSEPEQRSEPISQTLVQSTLSSNKKGTEAEESKSGSIRQTLVHSTLSGDPQFFILDENHPEPFHFYLQGNLVDDVSTDPQPTVLSKDYIVPVEEFSDQTDPNESKAHVFHNLCLNDMDTTKFDYTFPHYDSGLQLKLSQPTANPSQSQYDAVEHQAIEKSEEPTSESEQMSEAGRESLKQGSSCEKGKEAEEPNSEPEQRSEPISQTLVQSTLSSNKKGTEAEKSKSGPIRQTLVHSTLPSYQISGESEQLRSESEQKSAPARKTLVHNTVSSYQKARDLKSESEELKSESEQKSEPVRQTLVHSTFLSYQKAKESEELRSEPELESEPDTSILVQNSLASDRKDEAETPSSRPEQLSVSVGQVQSNPPSPESVPKSVEELTNLVTAKVIEQMSTLRPRTVNTASLHQRTFMQMNPPFDLNDQDELKKIVQAHVLEHMNGIQLEHQNMSQVNKKLAVSNTQKRSEQQQVTPKSPYLVQAPSEQLTQSVLFDKALENEEKQPPSLGTESIVKSCMQTAPGATDKAQIVVQQGSLAFSTSMNNLDLDLNLSLSELLRRVRARNRLKYLNEIQAEVNNNMSILNTEVKPPPTDRPKCPPAPDCPKPRPPLSSPNLAVRPFSSAPTTASAKPCPPPPPKCPPAPPKCLPDPPKCPPDPPKCPPDPPKCPPDPPKCPPEPPKCPPDPPKCPPDPPKCPSDPPKCPPDPPKCPPDPPKCSPDEKPVKAKCPACPPKPCPPPSPKCCTATNPDDPVTISPHLTRSDCIDLFKTYFRTVLTLLNTGLLLVQSRNETASLKLNRVKDFDPWVPIPSIPHNPPKKPEKPPPTLGSGCPFYKPGLERPPCPELPCTGFPKRLSFAEDNLLNSSSEDIQIHI